ncbi:MAG: hypothetical protein NTZ38_01710 [Candidatus Taylorbacteria bacterium]|nr:hypothetical protein [Candidatus Taylorbacteria bacterium]
MNRTMDMAELIGQTETIIDLLEVTMFQAWKKNNQGERLEELIREYRSVNTTPKPVKYVLVAMITFAIAAIYAALFGSAIIMIGGFVAVVVSITLALLLQWRHGSRILAWEKANKIDLEIMMRKLIEDVDALKIDNESPLCREQLAPEAIEAILYLFAGHKDQAEERYRPLGTLDTKIESVRRVVAAANLLESASLQFEKALKSAQGSFGLFPDKPRKYFFAN